MATPSLRTRASHKREPNFGSKHIDVDDSSLVEKVFYDPDMKVLDAVFKKGTRYRYRKVPPGVVVRFVLAKSMGKFFNANIRDTYPYKRVDN